MVTPAREEGVAMKIFFWTLALLMAGLAFVVPPLMIVVLPALLGEAAGRRRGGRGGR